ncbi:MAG: hypothetical protein ACJAZP_000125 [Psychromonas sp.]|jgi:hypothetical protein|uniref:hypothetical protein n=1 Tax=Psychromonas sp. TaxID=1884585 RepID=UPI0039E4B1E2
MPTYAFYLLKFFALTLTCLTISACGGGDSSDTPTEPDFFAEGIYIGSTETNGVESGMVAVIGADGTFESADIYYRFVSYGVLNASSQNQASGTITLLAAPGGNWSNGEESILVDFEITQSSTDNSITGSTSYQNGTPALFSLQSLQQQYDNPPSDFGIVAGTYLAEMNSLNITLSIDDQGLITGSDTDNCNYSAQLQQAVNGKNLYNLTVSVTVCDSKNGDYEGQGFFIESSNLSTYFALIAHVDNNGVGGLFTFQNR